MFHRQQTQTDKKTDEKKSKEEMTKPQETWTTSQDSANTNTERPQTMNTQTNTTQTDENTDETNNTAPSTDAAQGFANRQGFGGRTQFPNYGQSSTTQTSTSQDRQLVIGEGITMAGEIAACEHLIVQGQVEAALKGARVLDISETGRFNGKVEIEEATIAGTFEGDITVEGRLTVKSTGVVTGTIAYGELAVEAGATMEGKLGPTKTKKTSTTTTSGTTTTKTDTTTTTTKKTTKTTGKTKTSSTSNDDNELPFAASAAE